MITLRLVRVALLLLIAAILPRELCAHEATLGVLEFREVRPGAFVGRWTMEPAIGLRASTCGCRRTVSCGCRR
jgi:hypothetical protein